MWLLLKKILGMSKELWFVIIIATLSGMLIYEKKENNKLTNDNDRLAFNIENIGFKFDTLTTENGKLKTSVNQLSVKKDEFKFLNDSLKIELDDMDIKLKNTESVTKIEIKYVYIHDTIPSVAIKPDSTGKSNKFSFNKEDEYTKITGIINSSDSIKSAFIESFNIKVNDGIVIAFENKYSGWWFWKKLISTKLHIKSDNPAMQINKIQTYKFN